MIKNMDLGERIKNLNLGERIKKVREEKGIKQKDLADKIGISYVMLSQYERGVRTPKYEMIDKIAKSLDIDPFYLMYGENDPMLSVTNFVKEFNNSTELINQKIDMVLKAFDINNIKYEISKQTHNKGYILEIKVFLNGEFFTLDTDELIYIYGSAYNIFNDSVKSIIELIENYKKG
ncbi:MAG: helix-turn-helix domain-containing protein [Lachnospirales bacterium]